MKKIIAVILLVTSIISVTFAGLKIKEYNDIKNGTSEEDIKEIDEKIEKVKQETLAKQKELEELKESKKDEIDLLKVWQEKVNQIQSYL